VTIFAGGWEFGRNQAWRITGGAGLITVLTLIAAVILAISGHYPQRTFDLVMGLNRWCYRVLAYVALISGEYPPFRLDAGGTDPRPPLPAPGRPAPGGSSGRARNIDAGHEGARQDRSGCTCMAGDCQFSARGAAQAQRAADTSCSCWRAWPGRTCSQQIQNDLGGGPGTTRRYSAADAVTTSLMACRIRREANRQSRAHTPVGRRDRLTHLSATAGAASRSSWRIRRPGSRSARSVTFRIQCRLATLRL